MMSTHSEGDGPSLNGTAASAAAALLAVVWIVFSVHMNAPPLSLIAGLVVFLLALLHIVLHVRGAVGWKRMPLLELMEEDGEDPDPALEYLNIPPSFQIPEDDELEGDVLTVDGEAGRGETGEEEERKNRGHEAVKEDTQEDGENDEVPESPHGERCAFCPYCGARLNADFRFCPRCGRKLPVLR